MELLTQGLLYFTGAVFVIGVLITTLTGSARAIKVLLAIVSGIVVVALVAGFIFSRGLLIYLTFQILALVMLWYLVLIAGAVCGGGIYLLLHRKRVGKALTPAELGDYLPLAEFSRRDGIEPERALVRIRSGYYLGGSCEGQWYVHKSELR